MVGQKLINLGFYPILFICVSISTIASYYGLEQTLGRYTLAGAAVIGLVLFMSTTAINLARISRTPILGPLFLFFLALVFSTASNFNYFYTRYLQLDLARGAYAATVEDFKLDIEDAKKRLAEDESLTQLHGLTAEIDGLLTNLKAQLNDPNNKGAGPRVRIIVDEIRGKLPDMTTLAYPTTNNDADLNTWFNQFEELVRAHMGNKASESQKDYQALVHDMDVAYGIYASQDQALQKSDNAPEYTRTSIEEMKRKMVEYTASMNRILPSSKVWSPPKTIDPEAGRVGDIVRTIESVFRTGGNVSIAIWSIIVSLFIDLVPMLYSLAVVRRVDDGDTPGYEPGGEVITK